MSLPLDSLLADIVTRLCRTFQPQAIYLYGSYARGEVNPGSDLDLLVVVSQSDQSFFERGAIAYRALRDVPLPLDIQVYTQSEFDARASLPVSFERTVRTTGKLLHAA
jgi:predicted nucleotidyltransferase